MNFVESIKEIVSKFGTKKIAESSFIGLLDDYRAFDDEPRSSKTILKFWESRGMLEKVSNMSAKGSQWKNDVADIIHQTEKEGFDRNAVSNLLHKLLLGLGIVNPAFDWNKEFQKDPTREKQLEAERQAREKAKSIDFPIDDDKNNDNADEFRRENKKPNKEKSNSNEGNGKEKKIALIYTLLGMIFLGIIAFVYFAARDNTFSHKGVSTSKEESSTIDEGQNNPQLSDMTDSETETEDIPVETYDASSFVNSFFYNFTKSKFDGFTNKGTLNDIIEHDLYGETATAQNLETVIWEEGISFTNEIKLNDVVFVFDKIDVYEYDESHFDKDNNTYEKQYHLSAPFQVIQYSFYLTGEASDNYKAIVEAMKTKLSGIYWVNFSDRTTHGIEYSYGESNQFSFLLIYTSTSIELKVYTDKYTYNTTINQIAR